MVFLKLWNLIQFVMLAHSFDAREAKNRVRRRDNKTPYLIHPVWCAMTIMTEEKLSEEVRRIGSQVLLLHDIPEDTNAQLPEDTEEEVRRLVADMTFTSSDEEMEKIWLKSSGVKLLKLYDKVSNLLDAGWMTEEKYERYCDYTVKLIDFVELEYGELNIVLIGRAIIKKRR